MNQPKVKYSLSNWDLVTVNPNYKTWNWKDLFCFWGVNIQSVIGFSLISSLYLVYNLNIFIDIGSHMGFYSMNLQSKVNEVYSFEPIKENYEGEVASRYIFDDLGTEIGFISSMTNPFCGSCTRARLSSDGKLYNCLFASKGMDIKSWIRSEMDDNTIEEKIVSIWKSRDDRYSELRYLNQNNKEKEKVEMYYIGG